MSRNSDRTDNILLGLNILATGLTIGAALAEPPRRREVVVIHSTPRIPLLHNVELSGYVSYHDAKIDGRTVYGWETLREGKHTISIKNSRGETISKNFDTYADGRVVRISISLDGHISLRTDRR